MKLTDLSLFNNEIEAVENLDGLNELHVISLGNNAIKELEYTMYLRRFNKLRMVNLAGNPICKDPEYRSYVLSHIKNLRYLDYRLVEESAILSAKEQYQDEMLEIEEKEAAEETREKQEAERAAHNALMEEANLEGVESLFDDMLRDDPEHAKLSIVPELQTGLAEFREKFDEHLEEFRTTILDQHKKKQEEHDEWLSTVNKATGAKDAAARKVVTDFERTKKAEFRSISVVSGGGRAPDTEGRSRHSRRAPGHHGPREVRHWTRVLRRGARGFAPSCVERRSARGLGGRAEAPGAGRASVGAAGGTAGGPTRRRGGPARRRGERPRHHRARRRR